MTFEEKKMMGFLTKIGRNLSSPKAMTTTKYKNKMSQHAYIVKFLQRLKVKKKHIIMLIMNEVHG